MRSHNHEFYYIMAKCCVDGELSHGRMAFLPAIYHPHPTVTKRDMRFLCSYPSRYGRSKSVLGGLF